MAFVSNDEINAIRAKADIISIVGSYIPLTQRGKNYFCVCPFHDDHSPSMSLSTDKQIYKCFSCGATGNVFSFVAEYENVSFIEAVSIVANKCGMELSQATFNSNVSQVFKEEHEIMELSQKFFLNNLRTDAGKEATKYLNDRGINDDTIKEFGIGLSLDSNDSLLTLLNKKNYDTNKLVEIGLVNNVNGKTYDMFSRRITFPLWDKDGNIVQRVRKTDSHILTITQLPDWDSVVPDSALSALDQRILKQDAQIKALAELANILDDNQVDNLAYDDRTETLQLMAGNKGIGNKVSVRDMLDDGIPVVDLDSNPNDKPNIDNDGCNCNCDCDCEDNVVEFGYSSDNVNKPDFPMEDDGNVVEF